MLVCFGERRRIVKLATPSLDSLHTSALQTFNDVLPPFTSERPNLLFQMQDDKWGGLFIDIEKTQVIPDRSVIKMILESEVVPSSESSMQESIDTPQVCVCIAIAINTFIHHDALLYTILYS